MLFRSHELREAQAQLVHREKMASIGQLVAGIAHEINNPVNFIQGNLHYLEEYTRVLTALLGHYEALGAGAGLGERFRALREDHQLVRILEDLQAVFDGCREGVDRTTSLVRDLRTFSRLDQPQRVLLDVHQTLDSTLNLLRGRLTGIGVQREYSEIPPVESYAGQLAQVFMNLLSNAVDALGDAGRVTVRTGCQGERVVVEVEDDGVGIEPEHLERIFDPFFTTKDVGKGTGLGLSQVFGFAKQSGGDVDVESVVGKGSTFTLYLPQAESTVPGEPRPTGQQEAIDGEGRCVLVVEDNISVGQFATQLLEDLGYGTAWVTSAEEALDRLGSDGDGFDIVFSDVDRKSTRLNSSHMSESRMPSSA